MRNTDVLILGAGIIGCTAAYEAARRGLAVTVLDRGQPGSEASGVGGGFISVATKKPGPHRDLARVSVQIYETLETELDAPTGSLGYRKNGSLIFAETERERASLDGLIDSMEPSLPFERWSGDTLREMEPELSSHLLEALYFPTDAEVFPLRVLDAYRRAGERLGVTFRSEEEVTGATRVGTSWEVHTTQEVWTAPRVVIAAGAWSGEVGKHFGLEVPVLPRRGQALLFPTERPLLRIPMLSAGYFGAKHQSGPASPSETVQLSLWQRPDGRLFAGGTREWAGFDTHPDTSSLLEIQRRAELVLPSLEPVTNPQPILGFRPYSSTGLPIIGPAPHHTGLFLATGHEGDGISLAPITGRLIGQCLAGETPDLDLQPFILSTG